MDDGVSDVRPQQLPAGCAEAVASARPAGTADPAGTAGTVASAGVDGARTVFPRVRLIPTGRPGAVAIARDGSDPAADLLRPEAHAAVQAVAEAATATALPTAMRGTGGSRPRWLARLRLALVVTDLLVAALVALAVPPGQAGGPGATSAALLPAAWIVALGCSGAYDRRVLGHGSTEFRRVLQAVLYLIALVAVVVAIDRLPLPRALLLAELPLAAGLDLAARAGLRRILHRRRRGGAALTAVLAVGSPTAVVHLAEVLARDPRAGMRVTGACLPDRRVPDAACRAQLAAAGIPVVTDVQGCFDVVGAARGCGAHTVAVLHASDPHRADPHRADPNRADPNRADPHDSDVVAQVAAQLVGTGLDLVVTSGLIGVAGHRLHLRHSPDLPFVHVDVPRLRGSARLVKGTLDRLAAAAALLLLAPALVTIAGLVRCTSSGPALFRQTRVGRDGATFTMIKFRTMRAAAEHELAGLLAVNEVSGGVLFKLRRDPRVTRVGRVLRRLSLDELPQLWNVLNGSMSLVGPRPPLPAEVARYGPRARRRLLVKPGLTGLWQVSGRSDLSWDEAIRLDLRYVENWSLRLDLLVLLKTVRAVLRADGAY